MKNLIPVVFFAIIISCSTNPNSPNISVDKKEITGKWILTETLADPGDGSGTWQNAGTTRTLEFTSNGLVKSSISFCSGAEVNEATYDAQEKIISTNCDETNFMWKYELKEGDLFLYPHNPRCIEACGSKYKKVED